MKTIFITGSSTGLGNAAARLFAAKGWTVLATMRDPSKDTLLHTLDGVKVLELDVTRPEQIQELVDTVVREYAVDVVFNNAGYGLAGPFEGASDEQVQRNINTNLMGVMRVTRAFLPHFRERGQGLFLNTTSIGGSITLPMNSVYHATKFALEGWSESLAFELEPFGIRVKTLAPGGIITDFSGRSLDMSRHPAYEEQFEQIAAAFMDPARHAQHATAEQIAEEAYAAVMDEGKQVKYIAGNDARGYYELRNNMSQEAFMEMIKKAFFPA